MSNKNFDINNLWREKEEVLDLTHQVSKEFLRALPHRNVLPSKEDVLNLEQFVYKLPENATNATAIIKELNTLGSPGTMLTASPRYFGFVNGGALPATIAAMWLATVWDQSPTMKLMSPTVCKLEKVVEKWIVDILNLPSDTKCSYVTGTTTADILCLVGARNYVLKKYGWDVVKKGLIGAPKIRVIVGEEVHTTMLRALRVIGIGNEQIEKVSVNKAGVIDITALPRFNDEPTIVCLNAGNTDTGGFDDFNYIIDKAKKYGA